MQRALSEALLRPAAARPLVVCWGLPTSRPSTLHALEVAAACSASCRAQPPTHPPPLPLYHRHPLPSSDLLAAALLSLLAHSSSSLPLANQAKRSLLNVTPSLPDWSSSLLRHRPRLLPEPACASLVPCPPLVKEISVPASSMQHAPLPHAKAVANLRTYRCGGTGKAWHRGRSAGKPGADGAKQQAKQAAVVAQRWAPQRSGKQLPGGLRM